jgi:hypothetical protein
VFLGNPTVCSVPLGRVLDADAGREIVAVDLEHFSPSATSKVINSVNVTGITSPDDKGVFEDPFDSIPSDWLRR